MSRCGRTFLAAAETRLLPDGRIMVIHTRWHLDDLIGNCSLAASGEPQDTSVPLSVSRGHQHRWKDRAHMLAAHPNMITYFDPYLGACSRFPVSRGRSAWNNLKANERTSGCTSRRSISRTRSTAIIRCSHPATFRSSTRLNVDQIMLVVSAWDTGSKPRSRQRRE